MKLVMLAKLANPEKTGESSEPNEASEPIEPGETRVSPVKLVKT